MRLLTHSCRFIMWIPAVLGNGHRRTQTYKTQYRQSSKSDKNLQVGQLWGQ